jgi:cobyric acid synthase
VWVNRPAIGICDGYQITGKSIFDNVIEGNVFVDYEGVEPLSVQTWFDHHFGSRDG